MRNLLAVFFCILLVPVTSSAETIRLKNGRTFEAKILERKSDRIIVDVSGVKLTYWLDQIERIDEEPTGAPTAVGAASNAAAPMLTTPTASPAGGALSAEEIFRRVAPSVVVIRAQAENMNQGSGLIADPRGVILTNFHVVAGAQEIEVTLKDGRTFPVTGVIAYDAIKDLCVLKIAAEGLPTIPLGDANLLQPGQKLLVIGAPLGLEYSISDGLLSGKRAERYRNTLQFTAPVSPGNSGGPLLNTRGEAVGVTTYIKLGGENLNFAIAINEAQSMIHATPQLTMQEFRNRVSKAYALYARGGEIYAAGDQDGAKVLFEQALAADPQFAEAHYALGAWYVNRQDDEKAERALQAAVAANPRLVEAHSRLCQEYGKAGRLDEAMASCRQALALDPRSSIDLENLSVMYNEKGMHEEAFNVLQQAVAADPNNGHACYNLGRCYAVQGRAPEAMKMFQKALAIDPTLTDAHMRLAKIYMRHGHRQEAITHCKTALQLGEATHDGLLQVDVMLSTRDGALPQECQQSWSERNGEAAPSTAAGGPAQFTAAEEQALQQLGDSELQHTIATGLIAHDAQGHKTALEYHQKALTQTSKGSPLYTAIVKMLANDYVWLAVNYGAEGLDDEAFTAMNQVVALSESSQDHFLQHHLAAAYRAIGGIFIQRGNHVKAQEYLEKLRTLHTSDSDQWAEQLRQALGP